MDFWASLEHQLHYKSIGDTNVSSSLTGELKQCAETIAETDLKMQEMFRKINNL
jgi:putative GTP pyrophosphokinase